MDELARLQAENENLRARIVSLETEKAGGELSFLKSVLAVVPAFIIRTDPQMCVRYMNQFLPGYSMELVRGTSVYDYVAPDYVELARKTYTEVQRTGAPGRYSVVAFGADGKPGNYDCYVAPIPESDGQVGICVVAMDVTEHLERQRALAESESKLRVALAATGIGLWSWDLSDDAVVWDERMHEITGLPEPVAVDRYVEEVVHPEDRAALAAMGGAARQGNFEPSLHRLIRPDGSMRWVISAGSVMSDADGNPLMIVGGNLDVTEARSTEDQLRQAQKMDAVGNLTAGIAHNFNNMLMAILPALSLLREVVPPSHADLLDDARNAAERAAELVRQLMTFAGQRSQGPRQRHSMASIVGRALAICRRAFDRHIELLVEDQEGDLTVLADAGGLEQVLVNVLLNARDAVTESGKPSPRITIATQRSPDPGHVVERGTQPRSGVEIRIHDDGIGMPPETLRRMFEPFFTTKAVNAGTGLGLTTSYAIVRDHSGRMSCDSSPGKGTTFKIWLPLAEPGPDVQLPKDHPRPPRGASRILLVDDEPAVRRVVERLLRRRGHDVVTAGSGAEAVAALESDARIDLILLDRSMPQGPGRDFVDPIRALAPEALIVYFTGQSVPSAERQEVDGEIHKPVDPDELFETLNQLLDDR